MNDRRHLSSETIDLMMLSSLAEADHHYAKAHLSECGECKARLTEAEADKARFEQFIFPRTLPKVEERAKGVGAGWLSGWRQRLGLYGALGAVAAALLAVVVLPGLLNDDPYIGIKGGLAPTFEVVASRDDAGQFRVTPGMALRPGDRLRFVIEPAGARYLLIASRDGQGNVTVYYPYGGAESAEIRSGKQELPGSIELDEVAGRERLVALFSNQPLRADQVAAALKAGLEEPRLPPGARQVSWEFVKEAVR
jgi:hypothetical protein